MAEQQLFDRALYKIKGMDRAAIYEKKRREYESEAKGKWESTAAYREYEKKTNDYSSDKWKEVGSGMEKIMAAFAKCRNNGYSADSSEAEALVRRLQDYYSLTHVDTLTAPSHANYSIFKQGIAPGI